MARPTKYQPELHIDWGWTLAVEGKTDAEIAREFGISVATLNDWKKRFPEFLESLKEGKETADAKVERSLFRRAVGFTGVKTRKKCVTKADGSTEETEETLKFGVPPNITAQIFWLKNRRPETWRNRDRDAFGTEMEILPGKLDLGAVVDEIENPEGES